GRVHDPLQAVPRRNGRKLLAKRPAHPVPAPFDGEQDPPMPDMLQVRPVAAHDQPVQREIREPVAMLRTGQPVSVDNGVRDRADQLGFVVPAAQVPIASWFRGHAVANPIISIMRQNTDLTFARWPVNVSDDSKLESGHYYRLIFLSSFRPCLANSGDLILCHSGRRQNDKLVK